MGERNEKGQFISGVPRLGFRHSEETKKQMSESRKGKHPSLETRKRLSIWQKGKPASETVRRNLKREHPPGENHPRFGKHFSEESRLKMSESHKGKTTTEETKKKMSFAHLGEKSYLWRGGTATSPYPIDWTKTLRKSIRERDHYICQICNDDGIDVHHIDYRKINNNPTNLITLCRRCHLKTNSNRESWMALLTDMMAIKCKGEILCA